MTNDTTWDLFITEQHLAAQRNCRHVIHCAVDGPTRKTVSEHLDYARSVGDGNDIVVRLAQLTGPCCLPPGEPSAEPTATQDQL